MTAVGGFAIALEKAMGARVLARSGLGKLVGEAWAMPSVREGAWLQ